VWIAIQTALEEAVSNSPITYAGLNIKELSWSSNPITYAGLNRKELS
jgi:hypothetical protein